MHTLLGYAQGVLGEPATSSYDIMDPFDEGMEEYRACAQQLAKAVELLVERLEHERRRQGLAPCLFLYGCFSGNGRRFQGTLEHFRHPAVETVQLTFNIDITLDILENFLIRNAHQVIVFHKFDGDRPRFGQQES